VDVTAVDVTTVDVVAVDLVPVDPVDVEGILVRAAFIAIAPTAAREASGWPRVTVAAWWRASADRALGPPPPGIVLRTTAATAPTARSSATGASIRPPIAAPAVADRRAHPGPAAISRDAPASAPSTSVHAAPAR
jgi:hypothetical protein